MIVKSFGCSFIAGNELSDYRGPNTQPSELTWPALIAQQLGLEHQGRGIGGIGNVLMTERIISELSLQIPTLYIIGWTWIDRFDYATKEYTNLMTDWNTIQPGQQTKVAEFYYKHIQTELRDQFASLTSIKVVVDLLKQYNQPFIMTAMDPLLFSTVHHPTFSLDFLQGIVRPYLIDFDGKTFLEWAKQCNFEFGPQGHPLERAHVEAAKLMLPHARAALDASSRL